MVRGLRGWIAILVESRFDASDRGPASLRRVGKVVVDLPEKRDVGLDHGQRVEVLASLVAVIMVGSSAQPNGTDEPPAGSSS